MSLNSDFSSATWTMVALSQVTDSIVAISGITIAAPDVSFNPAVFNYAKQSVTYNQVSSLSLDVKLQTEMQILSVSESTTSTQTPNLSCSFSGLTSIVYSLNSYNGSIIPPFVLIDSATGVLTIEAQNVSSSTMYSFYIVSTIQGVTDPFQNIVNLTINKCTASNCQKCSANNSSTCTSCNSGYNLNSGTCILLSEISQPKIVQSSVQIVIGATIVL